MLSPRSTPPPPVVARADTGRLSAAHSSAWGRPRRGGVSRRQVTRVQAQGSAVVYAAGATTAGQPGPSPFTPSPPPSLLLLP